MFKIAKENELKYMGEFDSMIDRIGASFRHPIFGLCYYVNDGPVFLPYSWNGWCNRSMFAPQ